MAGQSNMAGLADKAGLSANLQAPQTDILFYDGGGTSKTQRTLMSLQPNSDSTGTYFGPEITFGRAMEDANPNDTFALIKYGDAGKSLAVSFAPGAQVYNLMISTFTAGIQALVNAGYTVEIIGMLWLQGEADAATSAKANAYEANLTAFINDMRSRYGADLPFIIGGMGYVNYAERDTVMAAQANLAVTMTNVSYFSNDDINSVGNLHFDAAQMSTVGERYATELQAYAVPEPSTCVMVLGGLGVLGMVPRFRRVR